MTTSSTGKVERLAVSPPPREMPGLRYYRCRGSGCTRAQLSAKAIESLVPRLFADPSSDAPDYVRSVFLDVSRRRDVLTVPNRRRVLVSLCSEIRWDAERSTLRIIADEEGIANWREGWRQVQVAREAGWPARR